MLWCPFALTLDSAEIETNASLREALERVGLLTVMLDGEGRVQYVGAHPPGVVGSSQEELLGKDGMGLVPPAEVVAVVRPRFQEVMDEPFVDLRDERETDLITR